MSTTPCRVLFTGYAPVHFLCFRPLYEHLVNHPGFEVWLSGGLRTRREGGDGKEYSFDHRGMYQPLGVSMERVLPLDTVRRLDFDVLFAGNTKMLEPASVGTKIQIFHGVSFRNRAIRKENLGADHFFVVGPYMRRKFAESGMIDKDDPRLLSIGFMKTDALLRKGEDRMQLLRRFGMDGSRPVLVYAPTGQKKNSLVTMGEDLVRALQATGNFDILIKMHDHPKFDGAHWASRMAALEDEHTRLADTFDVVPLLKASDLLLTDASSVSTEYTLLDRPIVFLDVPGLIHKAASREGSMLDLDTWGRKTGLVARDPSEAVAAVEQSLVDPGALSPMRQSMARDLFYNPGGATRQALAWVMERFLPSAAVA